MKKLLISSILIASVVGQVNVVDAKGQVSQCYTASKVQVKSPNMLDTRTTNAIKMGTYGMNGIKINQRYSAVKKALGAPKLEVIEQSQFGKSATLKYNNVTISLISTDRYAKNENLEVINIEYTFPKQNRYTINQIQREHGKTADTTTNGKYKEENYNNYSFNYIKSGKSWVLKSMSLSSIKEYEIIEKILKKNNRKTKIAHNGQYTITNSDIKHMKKGTFSLKGAKLKMTPAQATKSIGQSLKDQKVITPYGTTASQDYAFGEVNLNFQSKHCTSAPVLKVMTFDYQSRGLTFSKIERLVGKPNKVVNGKKESIYINDKDVKVKTRTNTYGHLVAKGQYIKGKWQVTEVKYK